jgi:hypothetical protein
MSEIWLRLGILVGGVLLALLVVLMLRRPARGIATDAIGLDPGVYLFSSITCADCAPARSRLADDLGPTGFVEIRWEDEPGLFAELGVEAVPCTVIVSDTGVAARFPGMPDRALDRLNP